MEAKLRAAELMRDGLSTLLKTAEAESARMREALEAEQDANRTLLADWSRIRAILAEIHPDTVRGAEAAIAMRAALTVTGGRNE